MTIETIGLLVIISIPVMTLFIVWLVCVVTDKKNEKQSKEQLKAHSVVARRVIQKKGLFNHIKRD